MDAGMFWDAHQPGEVPTCLPNCTLNTLHAPVITVSKLSPTPPTCSDKLYQLWRTLGLRSEDRHWHQDATCMFLDTDMNFLVPLTLNSGRFHCSFNRTSAWDAAITGRQRAFCSST
jgi:hypothetical protein